MTAESDDTDEEHRPQQQRSPFCFTLLGLDLPGDRRDLGPGADLGPAETAPLVVELRHQRRGRQRAAGRVLRAGQQSVRRLALRREDEAGERRLTASRVVAASSGAARSSGTARTNRVVSRTGSAGDSITAPSRSRR
jgi:hypothetical protein